MPQAEAICATWPPAEWRTALRVARCESGADLYPLASSGSSHGVFQLWGGHVARWPDFWAWVYDPAANIAHAYELWQERGWWPWACY